METAITEPFKRDLLELMNYCFSDKFKDYLSGFYIKEKIKEITDNHVFSEADHREIWFWFGLNNKDYNTSQDRARSISFYIIEKTMELKRNYKACFVVD